MTEANPIPPQLSHLTQRDAAVRARASEGITDDMVELAAGVLDQHIIAQLLGTFNLQDCRILARSALEAALIPTPPAPDETRGPHNTCGAGSCDQPDRCTSEGECHYTKSPFYQPSRAAPSESAIRAELVAALRDMLVPYNGVPDDALQQGAETGDQRCVRALKARAALAKAAP